MAKQGALAPFVKSFPNVRQCTRNETIVIVRNGAELLRLFYASKRKAQLFQLSIIKHPRNRPSILRLLQAENRLVHCQQEWEEAMGKEQEVPARCQCLGRLAR